MSDIVVTVPKSFGLDTWIEEGDAAGEPWSGELWDYRTAGNRPRIQPGERVYVVFNGKVRGYAPLVELIVEGRRLTFMRGGGAVVVTVPETIIGFRGWRYRWWDRSVEQPFPEWRIP